MALVLRQYIEGGTNTPRFMLVEDNDGAGDILLRYDPTAATKLQAIDDSLPPVLINNRLAVDSVVSPSVGAATLAVAAGAALTSSVGVNISTSGFTRFRVQINNTGSSALNGFEVATRAHPSASADWQIHLNTGTHFTAPSANSILRLSGDTNGSGSTDPTILAASTGKIILAFNLRDFFAESFRFRASAAAATSLSFFWGGQ